MRVLVNTPTPQGSTGITTNVFPSMTLGCGAMAGNSTSDNVGPHHLINIKRLAYELPREARGRAGAGSGTLSPLRDQVAAFVDQRLGSSSPLPALPAAPAAPPPLPAVDFVSEDDVRRALREGRTIRVAARAIITPAARDAAAGGNVLVVEGS